MNFLKHRKKILMAAACGVIIVLISSKIISPFSRNWTRQTSEIKKKKILLEKSREIIGQKEELTKRFSDLSRKVQAKLSLERGENTFLNAIGSVAEYTNVHVETMNPLPLRDLGAFNEVSVEINMQANLGNLVRFLYQMRKSSVVLVAKKLRLEPKSERSALLKCHLVISTILLKEQR
ncbi:MAG: hypothetical protein GY853_13005 [PVC group bacterium]|nr:hypothetical protein [PVC group bacterium]